MSNSAKVFYQEDCDLTLLYGKTIAVTEARDTLMLLTPRNLSETMQELLSVFTKAAGHGQRPRHRALKCLRPQRLQSRPISS